MLVPVGGQFTSDKDVSDRSPDAYGNMTICSLQSSQPTIYVCQGYRDDSYPDEPSSPSGGLDNDDSPPPTVPPPTQTVQTPATLDVVIKEVFRLTDGEQRDSGIRVGQIGDVKGRAGFEWQAPDAAVIEDGANSSVNLLDASDHSNMLVVSGFGFDLPRGAVPLAVTVSIVGQAVGSTIENEKIGLVFCDLVAPPSGGGPSFAFITAGYDYNFATLFSQKYIFETGATATVSQSSIERYSGDDTLGSGWGNTDFALVPGGTYPNATTASKYTYASDAWVDDIDFPIFSGVSPIQYTFNGPPDGQTGRDGNAAFFNNSDRGVMLPTYNCAIRGPAFGDYNRPFLQYTFATDAFEIDSVAVANNPRNAASFGQTLDHAFDQASMISNGAGNEQQGVSKSFWSGNPGGGYDTFADFCSFNYADSTFVFGTQQDFNGNWNNNMVSLSSTEFWYSFNADDTFFGAYRWDYATETATEVASALSVPREGVAGTSIADAGWTFGGSANDYDNETLLAERFDFATEVSVAEVSLQDSMWGAIAFSSSPGWFDV